jgi:hypothetical protein
MNIIRQLVWNEIRNRRVLVVLWLAVLLPAPWADGDEASWVAGTELHVYALFPVARYQSPELTADGYQLTPFDAGRPMRRVSKKRIFTVDLPEHPSEKQIQAALDSIIRQSDRSNSERIWQREFDALPPAALVALVRRMPIDTPTEWVALKVLEKHVRELPGDVLLDVLRLDSGFVRICVKKGLGAEAADILRPRVLAHKPLPRWGAPDILEPLAEHGPLDEPLNAAILWCLPRMSFWKNKTLRGLLPKLRGADFKKLVAEAWAYRIEKGSAIGLAAYAMGIGDKEALRMTLKELPRPNSIWPSRSWLASTLAARLASDLPPEQAWKWACEHFSELEFDAETGKWIRGQRSEVRKQETVNDEE